MTSKNRCIRCNKEIKEVNHCEDCWDWLGNERSRLLEDYIMLRKILKGIMEIARVVEQ